MKNKKIYFINIVSFLLILLWVYAAASKLMDFNLFEIQMHRQLLPEFLKDSLVFILPPVEIGTALLLLFEKTIYTGLIISGSLLFVFTIYILLAITHLLGKVPCSCGGILTSMGWGTHLVFNLVYLLLTSIGIIVYRERRAGLH
jgi:putative oxidoreductase